MTDRRFRGEADHKSIGGYRIASEATDTHQAFYWHVHDRELAMAVAALLNYDLKNAEVWAREWRAL